MRQEEYEAPVAAFIRSNGVTRRPAVHALPTQAAPGCADRAALQRYAGVTQSGDDLPPPNTKRWVVRRKAAVVTAVRSGRITLEEALQRYQLTEEEYRSWERAFEQHGLPGLRSTRLQQYRTPRPRRGPRSRR